MISALCGDLGSGGFIDPKRNEKIERSKRILELARELETECIAPRGGRRDAHAHSGRDL